MGTMDNIIDKIADTTENMKEKVADKFGHDDDDAAAPTGAHRGEAADEHKPGIMDKIADATEKLVDKYDHSDASGATTPNPPIEYPAAGANLDPSGKV